MQLNGVGTIGSIVRHILERVERTTGPVVPTFGLAYEGVTPFLRMILAYWAVSPVMTMA